MSLHNFSDALPTTQLTTSVGSGDTTWHITSSQGFPPPPFEFVIDESTTLELCLCTNFITPTSWTVQRGYDSTTPASHSISPNQIQLIVSQIIFQESNAHITADPDEHTQYMRASGARHDSLSLHIAGPLGTDVNVPTDIIEPSTSHWGDSSSAGTSHYAANQLHIHGREAMAEVASGLWPTGTIMLWPTSTPPPGWLPCDGRTYRTDHAPELFNQIGYTYGAAVDWFAAPPLFLSALNTAIQDVYNPFTNNPVSVTIPYGYLIDPRTIAIQLPPGQTTYGRLPNLPNPTAVYGTIAVGLQWIIKADYGYVWTPRPIPPTINDPNQIPIQCAPYRIHNSIPIPVFVNGISATYEVNAYEEGIWDTTFSWGFDYIYGLPAFYGSGFIGPGEYITGPFTIPVVPYGSPPPPGYTLITVP